VSLVLDTVKPTTPGTPVYSPSQCTITGNGSNSTRTVTFSWNPSTDTNFLGYRVFRNGSVISGSNTTPSTQWTDSSAGNTGPSYTVVAYDKAGNSSAVSGPLSFKSNKC
jgi:alpha-amylase